MIEQGRLKKQADGNGQGRPPAENDTDQAGEEEMDTCPTNRHVNQGNHEESRRHQGHPGNLLITDSPRADKSQDTGKEKAPRQPLRGKNSIGDVDRPGHRYERSSHASHKPSSFYLLVLGDE